MVGFAGCVKGDEAGSRMRIWAGAWMAVCVVACWTPVAAFGAEGASEAGDTAAAASEADSEAAVAAAGDDPRDVAMSDQQREAANTAEVATSPAVLPSLHVIGSTEAVSDLPGSGYYVDTEDIRTYSYDDINQILRRVPGVYLREEDGYGLFPNISLRGADTTRSSKVTIMEDGIPVAPAPYSAPAAYYSPTAGRMHAIEVLKGSSQVQYGPHNTGGVINYLSTPMPVAQKTYMKFLYGENNDVRIHAYHGDVLPTDGWGTFGYLIEGWFRNTDGFKEINRAPSFSGSDDTGFTTAEGILKLSWEPPSDKYQRFEFKYGYSDRAAEETYLGLNERDFNDDPYERYPASRFDNIDTWQTQTYLRHYIELSDDTELTSTLYYTRFHRNWKKLNDVRNIDTDGDGMGDGVNLGLSQAIAGAQSGVGLDVLRGMRAGDLRVRNNNRDYYSYGIDQHMTHRFDWGETEHELSFGWRYHKDRIRRYQWDNIYEQNGSGAIVDNDGDGIAFNPGPKGGAGNRRQETDAVALWVEDSIRFGKWTVTPGIRYEHLWQTHTDYNSATRRGEDTQNDLVGGGVGVNYALTDEWGLFGGVYRGFSPPDPRAAASGIEEETSIALEAGARYQHQQRPISFEATFFQTWFDDLIVIDNQAGGGAGITENVGEVSSTGLELSASYDAGVDNNWGFHNPWFVSATYTHARLDGDATSPDAESIFAGGTDGSEVPYIPEWVFSIGTGIEVNNFGIFVTGYYVDDMFTTASNTSMQLDPTGSPDARFGETDAHFIVDISAHYQINENTRLLGGVNNVFDEEYVASRHPHGARPGAPQFAYIGLELEF